MSDAESVVSEATRELQAEAERQFVDWEARDRMESMPRRRGLGFDEQKAQVEAKVRAELAREAKKEKAKEEKAKTELKK